MIAEPIQDPALTVPAPYRFAIPNTAGWLSANDDRAGKLYYKRARIVAAWRAAGRDHAQRAGTPALTRVRVIAEVCFHDRRKRDPGNFYDTAKAIMDGFVDAGVLPDDSAAYVIGPDMRLGPVLALGGHIGLVIMHLYPLDGGWVA